MSEGNQIILADHAQPAELTLADYESQHDSLAVVLRMRWRSMILLTLLSAAVGVGAVWTFVTPKYRVGTTIHVAPVVRPVLFPDYDTDISRQYVEFLETISLNMVSPVVINATLETPEVRSLSIVTASMDPSTEISRRIQVERIPGTQLLAVSMTGETPSDMATIVNKAVEVYLQRREAERRKWDDKILESLRHEEQDLETKLKSRREQMRQSAMQYGLAAGDDAPESMLESWAGELQQLLTEAKRHAASAAARLASLEAEEGIDGAINTDPAKFASYLAGDVQLQTLNNELRSLEFTALTDKRRGRGPGHPDVQTRPALAEALRERISARTRELREVFAASIRREAQARALDAETTARFLETEVEKARGTLSEERATLGGQKFVLNDLAHERERFENDLNRIRQKVWNIELERNRTARISVAAKASAPMYPNIDKRPKYAAVAVFFSLLLGGGVAMLRHRCDTRFRSPVDVTSRLGVRVLGSVQHVPDIQPLQASNDSRVVEPIRGISTALLVASNKKKSHARLVTSPTAQSGKSSMALNLARSLASTGRHVLLVDADNHGQGLTRRLNLSERLGLYEFLEGTSSAEETVCTPEALQFDVLPAGRRDEHFGDALAGQEAQTALQSLFQKYDEVIVDSAPVLAGSSTVILATLVDEVVLVLRAGRSKTDEALAAQQHLASVGRSVVGVILNGVSEREARYSYSYAYASHAGDD